jgi:hypothetical protein
MWAAAAAAAPVGTRRPCWPSLLERRPLRHLLAPVRVEQVLHQKVAHAPRRTTAAEVTRAIFVLRLLKDVVVSKGAVAVIPVVFIAIAIPGYIGHGWLRHTKTELGLVCQLQR